jgi:hypothetical protein
MGCGQINQAAAPVDASPDGPGCVPPPSGLQARWRGEMNAADETGAHDGVAMSGRFTAGRHGAAFVFDGIDSIVSADPQDALWPPGSFSVELWVKASGASAPYSEIMAKYGCGGADGCDGSDYELLVHDDGHPAFAYRVNGGQTQIALASLVKVLDSEWHHLVGVRDVDHAQQRFYVDGTLAVSRPIGGVDLGALSNVDGKPDPITIGAVRAMGADTMQAFFLGAVDEVAIYYAALDDSEVAMLHAAPDGICIRE